jgi:hypothetical protein
VETLALAEIGQHACQSRKLHQLLTGEGQKKLGLPAYGKDSCLPLFVVFAASGPKHLKQNVFLEIQAL